jgi:predicted DCC family thiol-disulfide oxidoreductase YuxK
MTPLSARPSVGHAPNPVLPGSTGPVLLFDGECGLCNRVVRLLLRLDRKGRLRFAPLQGMSAQNYLRVHGLPTVDFETIIYVPDWSRRDRPQFLLRTAGVIAALRAVGGGTARMLAALLALFPTRLRDAGYRLIGAWRHRFFGPWHPRPLPRPEWAGRFLV